jgi:hypothetical protein
MAGIIFVSSAVVTIASLTNSTKIRGGEDFNQNKIDLRVGKNFERS